MYKLGLSSCGFELTEENFQNLRNASIDAIEISMAAENYKNINYREVAELSKRYGIELWSYHFPFAPFNYIDISSLDSTLRQNAIDLYTDMIKKASDIGIDKFIIHPSGEPIGDEQREDRILYSMQTLDKLAQIAHEHGAIIAVEDLPRSCLGNTADEILRLISANEKLRVCFDTNHLLADNNINFIERIGDKIVTVHVSDYDFVDEKHWLPGEGMVDWKAFFEAFKKINYRGVWLYELGLKTPATITRSRDLTFEDFVRNAHEIFDGRRLTRIE